MLLESSTSTGVLVGGGRHSLNLVCLALAVVLAYASALPGNFVWIDHVEIEQGGYRVLDAQDFGRLWTQTLDQYLERHEGQHESRGGYRRPVYGLSISLDWALWRNCTWCYHVENVFWHLLVMVGLYFLGLSMFGSVPAGPRVVFWATLLFAVHPLGIHSVTWTDEVLARRGRFGGSGRRLLADRVGAPYRNQGHGEHKNETHCNRTKLHDPHLLHWINLLST